MTRIVLIAVAFVATQGFAESNPCLNQLMLGQLSQAQYQACVNQRTSTTTTSSQTAAQPTPTPAPGSVASSSSSGALRQLSWSDYAYLAWALQNGWISPQWVASFLYQQLSPQQQAYFYWIAYFYGSDTAANLLLASYGLNGSQPYPMMQASSTGSTGSLSNSGFNSAFLGYYYNPYVSPYASQFQNFLRSAFLPQ